MHKSNLFKLNNSPLKNLFLGIHTDDIEIGCGGTIP
jgi:LmbE family N-acetylglucosaminyl deacetylase